MFSTKQSDIFYNDETKEMFVCKVSAISAQRCEDNIAVYGALPLIYKINKADNYKTLVYPKKLDTFLTDPNSDLYNLTPTCAISGTNFNSITKPLINYNTTTSRYSVTFLGRYSNDDEGLGLNNYIFQDINSDFYLLDANIYIPKDKDITADIFTFENGYLNSDLYIVGNTVRNDKASWFNPNDGVIERSTDYQIAPMYVQATSSLGFNLILCNTHAVSSEGHDAEDPITGNITFPFMYSGGFITYNPKYVAYDPEYTIRVDFTARSFTVPSPTAYGSSQTAGQSASRWIQQYTDATTPKHGGPGEGFCVSFFKNPPVSSYVIPNGIGSTLGYAKAGFSYNEVAGTAQATDGLYVHNNWSPPVGIGSTISTGYLGPAESFLGVGFDIGGDFATTTEEKEQWFNYNSTWTATPCSVGIRASSYYDTQVLTAAAMSATPGATVAMHTSAASAEFVDYRVDLSNKGNIVTIYNKLTSATDYNTILEYRLNKAEGCIGKGSGTDISYTYQPWWGMQSEEQKATNTLPLLNVGLSFTTSNKASRFELRKFEVTGVRVNNPWLEKKVAGLAGSPSTMKKIDYLQESSKNLRKRLINVESDDLVDIEMAVKAVKTKPQITLCDGSNPEEIEEDVNVRLTGISPTNVDNAIRVGEAPPPTIITGGPTTFEGTGGGDTTTITPHEPEREVFQCPARVVFSGQDAWPGVEAHAAGIGIRKLKFGLGSAKGVVVFRFNPYTLTDRFQVFAGPAGVPPNYDKDGRPTNLVIDTGFHGHTNIRKYLNQKYRGADMAWSKDHLKMLSEVLRGTRHSYYAFNKTWANQIAYIKIWGPDPGTGWEMLLECPDAGPRDSQDKLIGPFDGNGISVDFPGWIPDKAGRLALTADQRDRGLKGIPQQSEGKEIAGTDGNGKVTIRTTWPNKNKYEEYTTGAGMWAQNGFPLDINGHPYGPPAD